MIRRPTIHNGLTADLAAIKSAYLDDYDRKQRQQAERIAQMQKHLLGNLIEAITTQVEPHDLQMYIDTDGINIDPVMPSHAVYCRIPGHCPLIFRFERFETNWQLVPAFPSAPWTVQLACQWYYFESLGEALVFAEKNHNSEMQTEVDRAN